MTLPALPFKIPEIPLPFDIPALMHPPIAHFIIALPVIILLLELINLIVKKKAIGVTSFFLLILTVIAAIAAFYTGSADGKAAWDLLSQEGQTALKAHKVMGTYLLLGSVIVIIFKLLSSMIQRGLMKALYLLVLIFFVSGILKQGQEGGDLVYKYGANIEKVKALDDEMFDVKEELDELKEEFSDLKEESESAVKKAVEVIKEKTDEVKKEVKETVEKVKEKVAEISTVSEEKSEEVNATVTPSESATPEAIPEATPEVEVVSTPEATAPEVATH